MVPSVVEMWSITLIMVCQSPLVLLCCDDQVPSDLVSWLILHDYPCFLLIYLDSMKSNQIVWSDGDQASWDYHTFSALLSPVWYITCWGKVGSQNPVPSRGLISWWLIAPTSGPLRDDIKSFGKISILKKKNKKNCFMLYISRNNQFGQMVLVTNRLRTSHNI